MKSIRRVKKSFRVERKFYSGRRDLIRLGFPRYLGRSEYLATRKEREISNAGRTDNLKAVRAGAHRCPAKWVDCATFKLAHARLRMLAQRNEPPVHA